jgi:DNA-binding NarL/FixJ family response regulator
MSRVRVLLVDDNDDFLTGISTWLAETASLELVGTTHSGRDVLSRIEDLAPDLVLMDVAMPDINGFELTRLIKSRSGAPQVVLLTFHTSETARLEAWAAGADAFVDKARVTEQLMPAIRDLLRERARRDSTVAREPQLSRQQSPPRDVHE